MGSNKFHRWFFLVLSIVLSGNCFSVTCEELKNKFNSLEKNSTNIYQSLQEYERLAQSGDSCAKNIIGRIFYEGVFVSKDRERAKAIFLNLTNSGYPGAMFNLAYALSEDQNPDYTLISNLLLGIYSKYITDKEYSALAVKARDFGYQLFAATSVADFNNQKFDFEQGIAAATIEHGRLINEQRIVQKEREDMFVSLLMLGMAAKSVGAMSSRNLRAPTPNFSSIPMPPPTLYQVTPLGGNMLYLLPLR
jgi:TPR repeat protein